MMSYLPVNFVPSQFGCASNAEGVTRALICLLGCSQNLRPTTIVFCVMALVPLRSASRKFLLMRVEKRFASQTVRKRISGSQPASGLKAYCKYGERMVHWSQFSRATLRRLDKLE